MDDFKFKLRYTRGIKKRPAMIFLFGDSVWGIEPSDESLPFWTVEEIDGNLLMEDTEDHSEEFILEFRYYEFLEDALEWIRKAMSKHYFTPYEKKAAHYASKHLQRILDTSKP